MKKTKKQMSSKPFRSAKEEVKKYPPQGIMKESSQLAFLDPNFLLRHELRPVRLQLELLKAELALHDEQIESTIVIFGSARIPEPKQAKILLANAKELAEKSPHDKELQQNLAIAQSIFEKSKYYDQARLLTNIISANFQSSKINEFVVITGGGPGIMEAANRGAFEVGGKSIGLRIVLPMEQGANPYITPELDFEFHYFAIRKMHFLIRARALIAFPGGFGTLDEVFETLTLLQTKKIKPIPVLLFGKDYWKKIINFEAFVEEGTISPEDLLLFQYVETAQEAWKTIADFYNIKITNDLTSKVRL